MDDILPSETLNHLIWQQMKRHLGISEATNEALTRKVHDVLTDNQNENGMVPQQWFENNQGLLKSFVYDFITDPQLFFYKNPFFMILAQPLFMGIRKSEHDIMGLERLLKELANIQQTTERETPRQPPIKPKLRGASEPKPYRPSYAATPPQAQEKATKTTISPDAARDKWQPKLDEITAIGAAITQQKIKPPLEWGTHKAEIIPALSRVIQLMINEGLENPSQLPDVSLTEYIVNAIPDKAQTYPALSKHLVVLITALNHGASILPAEIKARLSELKR